MYAGKDDAARLGEDIPLILQPAAQREATVNAIASGNTGVVATGGGSSLLMLAAVGAALAFALSSKSMKRGLSWG
jgi:hypothetical protein